MTAAASSDERYRRLFGSVSPALLERFKRFHALNPGVYDLFERFADEARRSGRKRFSHWMIGNRIRWYTMIETRGEPFKVSNDLLTIYARLLVWRRPEFEGFFDLRQCKIDRQV